MKKSLHFCLKCLFSQVYAFVLFEIGLRLFPGLIPLNLLILFSEGPRVEIARRRELPTSPVLCRRNQILSVAIGWNVIVMPLTCFFLFLAMPIKLILTHPHQTNLRKNFKYRFVFLDEVTISFNPGNADPDEVQSARYLTTLQTESEVLDTIENALKTFVDLSRRYNFVPVVTYTPSAHTAYAEYVVFDDPNLTGLMPSFSRAQRRYFNTKSKELGYVFIDFTPSLQAAAHANGPQELLYYALDLHLTPAGHAAVADILNQALNDWGILEGPGK